MKQFSGYEYLMIDVANQFGKDKLVFEDRIDWVKANMDSLEALTIESDTKTRPLYVKAVSALRKAQQGLPTGHLVGLDSVCSGVQIMSACTGCYEGALSTGLVDPNVRADAYSRLTLEINKILSVNGVQMSVARERAKEALMTAVYGSRAKPVEIFGEDTPELAAFYEAALLIAPGACELLEDLINSWQKNALVHEYKLPDGYDARIKVMNKASTRIEVDELDHATFTYEYYLNAPKDFGVSNAANVVHSIDAFVLRSMHRRCNYDVGTVNNALLFLNQEIEYRAGHALNLRGPSNEKITYYVELFNKNHIVDPVIFPYITSVNTQYIPTEMLTELHSIATMMLSHKPFELVTVHDEFKCHPNNLNHVRMHYREILAQLADSEILTSILSQIHNINAKYTKLSTNLSTFIRKSNYALS